MSASRTATISAINFGAATLAISSRANRDTARSPACSRDGARFTARDHSRSLACEHPSKNNNAD